MLPPHGPPSAPGFAFPELGDVLAGRYRLERKLGQGGMGIVVAAFDQHTGRDVAIKLLRPQEAAVYSDDTAAAARGDRHQEMSTRLIREASAASRIGSEHVTRVLDVGRLESGDPYVVMELLEGMDLGRYAKKRGPLHVAEAVDLVLQACDAIHEAHALGIVHRDLKPANLFLTRRVDGAPFVKVLDFGISKVLGADDNQLTGTTDMLGSPLFMAPEQIRNPRDVDGRVDVWSLGTILYRLLAGRAAFEAAGSAATLAAIIGDQPAPLRSIRPDVPVELEVVILRCLEKDRTRRVQSVRELVSALRPFAAQTTGVTALPYLAPTPPGGVPAMDSLPALTPSGSLPAFGASGGMSAFTPPGGLPALTPSGGMPAHGASGSLSAPLSVAPNAVTVSGSRGRPIALAATVGVSIAVLLAAGLLARKILSTESASAATAPVPSAAAAAGTGSAAVSSAPAPSAAASPAPAATAAPEPTTATAAPDPTAASPAAAKSAVPSASAKSSARPASPAHGRPSDDPLGDRL